MKTVSYLFMVMIAAAALTACEPTQGPSKPSSLAPSQILK